MKAHHYISLLLHNVNEECHLLSENLQICLFISLPLPPFFLYVPF